MLVVLVVVALLLIPVIWVQCVGQAHVVADLDAVPSTDVAIVFGAGLRPDGTPSTFLRRRLSAASELYARGAVRAVLVTGDNSRGGYDEPTAMRDWLVGLGVPEDAIVRDFAGLDTHDSCVRAYEVFGVDNAVLITQDYHLRRALFSCSEAGIDVVGVAVSAASVTPVQAIMYRVREVPASLKAAWDVITGREPHHLGSEESGIQDALDR